MRRMHPRLGKSVSVAAALLLSGVPAATAADPSAPPPSRNGWTYLALGDSNVYGPADSCGSCTTYPHLLAEGITEALGIPVRLLDGSQWNSLTSRRLLEEIEADSWGEGWEQPRDPSPSPRAAIAAADLITITVAANDQPWFQDPDPCAGVYDQACIDLVVRPYGENLDAILRAIAEIRAGAPTAVLVTTLYNDMIAGPGYDPGWYYAPDFLASSKDGAATVIEAINEAIRETAAANRATVVDMAVIANGVDGSQAIPAGWFSKDFGDLNQDGHEAFAAEIMRVGFETLDAPEQA